MCLRSEVVTFQGLISERLSLMDRKGQTGHTHSGVRLTVCDQSGRSLCVYLDLSHAPYPPGLLPGNRVLLSGFLRKLSRVTPPLAHRLLEIDTSSPVTHYEISGIEND
ncbi:hypothetical protein ILYODFUR_038366 [Ilyodon furcidens]|uniref:OB domain-containing protein n=1 Tax=Ilyodon furcidens TaxID=33524 RepID=A0ABV0TH53_9TELE